MLANFNNTLDVWISGLKTYEFKKLLIKPAPGSWSMGQVYIHLAEETNWYLKQIEGCFNHKENLLEEMKESARRMFISNELPDKQIQGDPFIAENINQPVSKLSLQQDFRELRLQVTLIGNRILLTDTHGKTRHPGLGYLSPKEWFQYAEMHMRHHLKQKNRIDNYLTKQQHVL